MDKRPEPDPEEPQGLLTQLHVEGTGGRGVDSKVPMRVTKKTEKRKLALSKLPIRKSTCTIKSTKVKRFTLTTRLMTIYEVFREDRHSSCPAILLSAFRV